MRTPNRSQSPPQTTLIPVSRALQDLREQLAAVSPTPWLDAQILIAHVLDRPRAWVLAHPEASLSRRQEGDLARHLAHLLAGRPLPYVIGAWEFYGRRFRLTPAVLIPRPETELLVETALAWLRAHPGRRLAADIGTGSGCIAITLACEVDNLRVLATDLSREALLVARANAEQHAVPARVDFIQANLAAGLRPGLDLVCANLPYIPSQVLPSLAVYGREPRLALDGGPEGLAWIAALLAAAPATLAPGGLLLAEIEASQGERALGLACASFPAAEILLLPDLAGHDRLLRIEAP